MAEPPPTPRRGGTDPPSGLEVAPLPPEGTSNSAQTIMLGLGALLLGVAAVTFVGVAITGLQAASQLLILLAVAGLFLAVPPPVAVRGLAATAETVAAIGLGLFAVAGYPLWNTGIATGISTQVYAGLVAAATAATAYAYHRLTGLASPAWAALLALQPVLPLLAAPLVSGPTGWALVAALLAAINAGLAVLIGDRPLGLAGWLLHAAALVASISSALAGLFLAATVPAGVGPALALIIAGAVAAAGGLGTRIEPITQLGAALLTLALIVACSRLAWLALPGRALLPIGLIMAAVALGVWALPPAARPGPRRASAWALVGLGAVVAGLALRAGFGALVWPPWPDQLAGYPAQLATAVGPTGWQLAATAVAATVGAGLALPAAYKREVVVAGTGLAALAIPASLGLSPQLGAWVMLVAAAGLGLTGLGAGSYRAAVSHLGAAGVVGLAAAGTGLAAPALTATVLAGITATGVLIAGMQTRHFPAELVTSWAAGAAALAAPGAAVTAAFASGYDQPRILVAGFGAACASLGYAALRQLRHRYIPLPVRAGAGLGALAVALAGFLIEPTPADVAVGAVILLAAAAVTASSRIDAIRRADQLLDGADLGAAAVTAAVVVVLARVTSLVLPITGADAALVTAAVLILLVTIGVRTLPVGWRRGPVVGVSLLGGLVAGIGAAATAVAGWRVLPLTTPLGGADLDGWHTGPTLAGLSWSPAVALMLLAIAAAAVLPRPVRYHASVSMGVLAAIAAPAGFGLPWWTPAGLSTVVGAGYALAAVGVPARFATTRAGRWIDERLFHPQAAWPRAVAAAVLAVHAVVAGLGRSWLVGTVLAVVAVVGVTVAALAAGRRRTDPRLRVGGTAVAGALLAIPGALAAFAAHQGLGAEISLPAGLAGASLGFVLLAACHAALSGPARRPAGKPEPAQPAATRQPATATAGATTATAGAGAGAEPAAMSTPPGVGFAASTPDLNSPTTGTPTTGPRTSSTPDLDTPTTGTPTTGPRTSSTPDFDAPTGAVAASTGAIPRITATTGAGTTATGGTPAAATATGGSSAAVSLAPLGPPLTPYLPFATIGVTAGATVIAITTLLTPHPTGVYAAAAVLLAVLAELVRASGPPGPETAEQRRLRPRPLVPPPLGALIAASLPAMIALAAIAPALVGALIVPYQALDSVWQGPPPGLIETATVPATSVLAALLLTLAAALAAVGFGGAVTRQTAPVTAPGLAVTVLIAPAALNAPWPTSTVAALLVFSFSMLGVALTPPPDPLRTVRPLRAARTLVLAIGLAAGGAGLAGALADPELTWATCAGAVGVGAAAALGGRTASARVLGWLFAAAAAHGCALTSAYLIGADRARSGFLLLVVSAVALLVVARLPRLRPPRRPRELAAVEWFGGYAPLAGALVLALESPRDLAAMLIVVGAVLGLAASRAGRSHRQRRVLWWAAALSEVLAWWILMRQFAVGLLEAYTLPFALFALLVGVMERRHRPELGSWVTFGPGLVAGLAPTLLLVVTSTSPDPVRQVWVILAGVGTLLAGSRLGQRAPLIIGSVVTAVAALHLLSLLGGPWLMLVPLGLLLLVLGANREKRQRDLERLRGAYSRMR